MKLKHVVLLVAVVGLIVPAPVLMAAPSAIGHTKNGCDGCHTIHNATANAYLVMPLWSGIETSTTFTLYSGVGGTFEGAGDITQPTGSSRMCLSCHDGTASFADANDSFGSDLSKHHPISFKYDQTHGDVTAGDLEDPNTALSGLGGTIKADMLDTDDQIQCTSCHDIHDTHTAITSYALIKPNTNGALCKTCHIK